MKNNKKRLNSYNMWAHTKEDGANNLEQFIYGKW